MDHSAHAKAIAATAPPLDPSLYVLDATSSTFFKSTTGIYDDDELREHILDVQTQAYVVVPYPCIRGFGFTRVTIAKSPAYSDVLKLGQERKGALFLDIGCGFGNDARKVALDGFPVKQIIASDLRRELWDLGHVLFRSNPDTFPVTFLTGDIFDPTFLSSSVDGPERSTEVDLSNVRTLNDVRGNVSAIWASSFFHLFTEKDQRRVARALASLLSPESGSIIFGSHVGSPSKGLISGRISERDVNIFCHNPDSWKDMWVGQSSVQSTACVGPEDLTRDLDKPIFSPDSVKMDTTLVRTRSEARDRWLWIMVWSITRV